MAENTAISWARHTWNPVMGCTKISPACDGCYAAHLMDTRLGKVKWGGERVRTKAQTWNMPFKWQRQAEKDGDRPFIFCSSLSDVFDNQWPAEWRRDAFDVMRATPNLVYLLLTKRPQNIVKLTEAAGGLPTNAAIGATCEDQKRADINVPHLIQAHIETRALFTFVSIEPMLGAVTLRNLPTGILSDLFYGNERFDALHPSFPWRIGWVIAGGETDQGDHKARPSHPEWFRFLRDQCVETETPFHFKQWGQWAPPLAGMDYDTARGRAGDPPAFLVARDGTVHCFSETAGQGPRVMVRYQGKDAGRGLDGREWLEFPKVAA